MPEERENKKLEAHCNKLLELYTDKSKHFQRVFTIVVGISAFFFLMILFPYFSLKYEYGTISQFNPLMNNMSEVTSDLDEIINDTQTIQNNIQSFHDIGIRWYQDLSNGSRQLVIIQYLKEQFNQTLSNSTLQQNLFEKFAREYGISSCDRLGTTNWKPFGTVGWRICNYDHILADYESRTKTYVQDIRKQLDELLDQIDIKTGRLNSTISNFSSGIQRLNYLSHFNINPLNLRSFFIDARDNIQTMGTTLTDIDESLQNFNFSRFKYYTNDDRPTPNQAGFERRLEEAIDKLQIAKDPIEQSNNNLVDQKTRINSISKKIADRLEQPNSPLGTLPTGFDELVSVFPIALAAGFFVCVSSFLDSMTLRKEFQHFCKESADLYITDQRTAIIAPLWLDPLRPEQNKIMRFAVLVIPFLIFVASCVLIAYSWTSPDMSIGGAYINTYVFGGLYLSSGGLFVYGYLKIVREYRNYINETNV